MSSKKAKGKRYSAEEKNEILDYVESVNAEKGRGGQSAASKKYKISPLTISSWLKARNGDVKVPAKRGRKPGSKNKVKTTSAATSTDTSGPVGKKLAKLQALLDEIDRSEKDLAKLKAQFDALKGSL